MEEQSSTGSTDAENNSKTRRKYDSRNSSSSVRFDKLTNVLRSSLMLRKRSFGKIYGGVISQFVCLLLVCLICLLVTPIKDLLETHFWLIYVFLVIFIVLLIALCLVEKLRKTSPINVIMLFALTLFNGLWLASLVAHSKLYIILYALTANALIAIVMTIFGVCSPYDINSNAMIVLLAGSILGVLISTFAVAYVFSSNLLFYMLGVVAIVSSSVYYFLITRLIIKQGDAFEDDWVLAVLILYTSVPHMIVYIIQTCGQTAST